MPFTLTAAATAKPVRAGVRPPPLQPNRHGRVVGCLPFLVSVGAVAAAAAAGDDGEDPAASLRPPVTSGAKPPSTRGRRRRQQQLPGSRSQAPRPSGTQVTAVVLPGSASGLR
jgi:hypothetical protein